MKLLVFSLVLLVVLISSRHLKGKKIHSLGRIKSVPSGKMFIYMDTLQYLAKDDLIKSIDCIYKNGTAALSNGLQKGELLLLAKSFENEFFQFGIELKKAYIKGRLLLTRAFLAGMKCRKRHENVCNNLSYSDVTYIETLESSESSVESIPMSNEESANDESTVSFSGESVSISSAESISISNAESIPISNMESIPMTNEESNTNDSVVSFSGESFSIPSAESLHISNVGSVTDDFTVSFSDESVIMSNMESVNDNFTVSFSDESVIITSEEIDSDNFIVSYNGEDGNDNSYTSSESEISNTVAGSDDLVYRSDSNNEFISYENGQFIREINQLPKVNLEEIAILCLIRNAGKYMQVFKKVFNSLEIEMEKDALHSCNNLRNANTTSDTEILSYFMKDIKCLSTHVKYLSKNIKFAKNDANKYNFDSMRESVVKSLILYTIMLKEAINTLLPFFSLAYMQTNTSNNAVSVFKMMTRENIEHILPAM